jgi:hypothetical protein
VLSDPCSDFVPAAKMGDFGMPERRSEPPVSGEEGCMTNSLRAPRLSLRYALAELQRCQDLRRLSRDNSRTAMRQSPELPSGVAGPRTAPSLLLLAALIVLNLANPSGLEADPNPRPLGGHPAIPGTPKPDACQGFVTTGWAFMVARWLLGTFSYNRRV